MFTSREEIIKKTGPNGIGRYDFLNLLVQEFYKTNSFEAKLQVLANLANFSYDPINYQFIKQLRIVDLFLNQLTQHEEDLIRFSISGLCNLSPDPSISDYIVQQNGVFLISNLLLHQNVEISLDALTTLIYLINQETHAIITTHEIINKVLHYSSSVDSRLSNLGNIFLQDYCTNEEIEYVKSSCGLVVNDIPLPPT
ncbi:hypothetical protein RI129_001598 [Pyrocoelia pectoralis]|uniref:Armadillo repeat-containing protein 7 n=1 Tax=Pyrocoelia pectoralis TaxID=417401 RepID=A0AAN7VYS9_9COLE